MSIERRMVRASTVRASTVPAVDQEGLWRAANHARMY